MAILIGLYQYKDNPFPYDNVTEVGGILDITQLSQNCWFKNNFGDISWSADSSWNISGYVPFYWNRFSAKLKTDSSYIARVYTLNPIKVAKANNALIYPGPIYEFRLSGIDKNKTINLFQDLMEQVEKINADNFNKSVLKRVYSFIGAHIDSLDDDQGHTYYYFDYNNGYGDEYGPSRWRFHAYKEIEDRANHYVGGGFLPENAIESYVVVVVMPVKYWLYNGEYNLTIWEKLFPKIKKDLFPNKKVPII